MILNYFEHPVSSLLYLTDIVYGRKIKDDTGCFNLYFQISVYILVNYIYVSRSSLPSPRTCLSQARGWPGGISTPHRHPSRLYA